MTAFYVFKEMSSIRKVIIIVIGSDLLHEQVHPLF
jgi:hypothetical protein